MAEQIVDHGFWFSQTAEGLAPGAWDVHTPAERLRLVWEALWKLTAAERQTVCDKLEALADDDEEARDGWYVACAPIDPRGKHGQPESP